jgi:hypothetical protein
VNGYLVNGVHWALEVEIPPSADVAYVDGYAPSDYN